MLRKYYFRKYTHCFYEGIIIAENEQEAKKIAEKADLDECFCEETCAELIDLCDSYSDLENFDLPIFQPIKEERISK